MGACKRTIPPPPVGALSIWQTFLVQQVQVQVERADQMEIFPEQTVRTEITSPFTLSSAEAPSVEKRRENGQKGEKTGKLRKLLPSDPTPLRARLNFLSLVSTGLINFPLPGFTRFISTIKDAEERVPFAQNFHFYRSHLH